MANFRELEAFAAVADLGSFEKAARSLATSQSNISRLVSDFEGLFDKPLLNREQRAARLTVDGEEVLRLARTILRHRAKLAERFGNAELMSMTLRLGVTELAALTWLGRFLADLSQRYPRLRVEPEVGSSSALHTQVRDGHLDMAIVLNAVRSTDMARLPIGTARFGWYQSTSLPARKAMSRVEFERQSVLLQGDVNSTGNVLSRWLLDRGVHVGNTIYSDSLVALAAICAAGLGIACLPLAVAQGPVRNRALRKIEVPVGAPEMDYIALARINAISDRHRDVASLARKQCDFQTPFDKYR